MADNFRRTLICSAAALGLIGAASAQESRAAEARTLADIAEPARIAVSDPTTIGLAFTYFWYDVHETPQDCPEGWAMALRDVAIMDLPEERQEFLLRPENRSTYYRMGYALSARRMAEQGGESICNIPTSYDDPPMRTVQSGTAYGRDLDGLVSNGSDAETCGTVDLTSPDGTPGVDNELYRVMGCIDSFRRDPEFAGGAMEDYHIGSYRDGETTTLMEIRGVDDRQNDDSVEIGVYASFEPTLFDSEKNGLPYASITVTDNKTWHSLGTGRIVDGELITDPFTLRTRLGWAGRPAEYLIYDTIIHLDLNEDGSAEGDLVGYFDLDHAYWNNFHDAAGALQVANGYTCPAVWTALQEHADGHYDEESGRCTAISTAMRIEAVPAFVIHPPENQLVEYVVDTSDYYGVPVEQIMVEGAELRERQVRSLGQSDEEEMMEELMDELNASDSDDSETY